MELEKWLVALRIACLQWHSGQWSRGYRLGCILDSHFDRSGTHPSPISGWAGFLEDFDIEAYYHDICDKYSKAL